MERPIGIRISILIEMMTYIIMRGSAYGRGEFLRLALIEPLLTSNAPSVHMLSIARAKHSKLMTLTGSKNAMLVKYCLIQPMEMLIIGTIAVHIDTVYSSIMLARSASPMSKSLLPAVKIFTATVPT